MDRFEPNLRIPGPTALPPSVREAGARQMINHRGPEFAAMLARILDGMKPYFGTTNDVAMISTAGSGGLEAAVVNTLSPGDRVLGVSIGSFGDRFAKIAGIYGADVTKLDAEWGYAAAGDEIRERLRGMPDTKAVLLTHNETSTGVMNPIAELAAAVRDETPDALILVDSVSGLGAVPFEMDAWGVDVVVTGVAEGLDVRAGPGDDRGLASAAGPRWRRRRCRASTSTCGRTASSAKEGQTPFTPAIAVVYQVDEGLRLMGLEGKDAIFARHAACAAAAQAGLAALGFQLFADPPHASLTVTAAHVPDGLDWKAFNAEVKRRGVVLAGGQGKLTGKIFRLGHLGSVTLEEILGAISTLEVVSLTAGPGVEPGAGGRCRPARGPRHDGHRRPAGRGRRMRVLVAESVAREGIELLRAHHEVDERIGCTREELAAILPELRRAHRPQPGPGRRRADRGRHAPRRHRAGRRRRRQRRPRRRDPGRASRSSTRRPATPSRPPSTRSRCCTAWRAGPPRPTRRCAAASGSARSSPATSCAAGRSASSASARSARRSRTAPGRWR